LSLLRLASSSISVALVGGNLYNSGNVYATNPSTGVYGPVCDDQWSLRAVSLQLTL